jgi:hypothetical protein
MRKVWIGLTYGAAVGAAVGVVLDLGEAAAAALRKTAEAAANALQEGPPWVAGAARHLPARATGRLETVDLSAEGCVVVGVNGSAAYDAPREVAHNVAGGVRDAGRTIAAQAQEVVDGLRAKIDL